MLRPTQQNQAATTLRRSHRSAKRLRDAAAPDTIEKLTAELERYKQRLESSQREFQRVAMTDPLTGCHNRRFFDQIIDREVQRHARYNIPLTLVFVDVDRFQSINDDMGHAMGDRLVQHVASLLQRYVRGSDYVFRWGGDEFVALMSCTEREGGSQEREAQGRVRFVRARVGPSTRPRTQCRVRRTRPRRWEYRSATRGSRCAHVCRQAPSTSATRPSPRDGNRPRNGCDRLTPHAALAGHRPQLRARTAGPRPRRVLKTDVARFSGRGAQLARRDEGAGRRPPRPAGGDRGSNNARWDAPPENP